MHEYTLTSREFKCPWHLVCFCKNKLESQSFATKKHPNGCYIWSGRRDSNSRHSPWQGDALPLSHSRISFHCKKKNGDPDGARTHDLQRDRLAF